MLEQPRRLGRPPRAGIREDGLPIEEEAKLVERPPLREEDPRERARKRAEDLRRHSSGNLSEGEDRLYVDPNGIPDGWTYEWKRHTVYGAEDPAYQVELQRRGWQPVPATRHPEMMPLNGNYQFIMRDGLILMECPTEIVEERRREDLMVARQRVRDKEAQLAGTPDGTLTRNHEKVRPKINKSYEAMPIPEK